MDQMIVGMGYLEPQDSLCCPIFHDHLEHILDVQIKMHFIWINRRTVDWAEGDYRHGSDLKSSPSLMVSFMPLLIISDHLCHVLYVIEKMHYRRTNRRTYTPTDRRFSESLKSVFT